MTAKYLVQDDSNGPEVCLEKHDKLTLRTIDWPLPWRRTDQIEISPGPCTEVNLTTNDNHCSVRPQSWIISPLRPLSLLSSSRCWAKPKSANFRIGGLVPFTKRLLGFRSMWEILCCLHPIIGTCFYNHSFTLETAWLRPIAGGISDTTTLQEWCFNWKIVLCL